VGYKENSLTISHSVLSVYLYVIVIFIRVVFVSKKASSIKKIPNGMTLAHYIEGARLGNFPRNFCAFQHFRHLNKTKLVYATIPSGVICYLLFHCPRPHSADCNENANL
jgi:hypothetical protein